LQFLTFAMIHFKDRAEAGRLLASALSDDWVHVDAVFAVPRGGFEAGAWVARQFDSPMLAVVTAKIPHPTRPELAIGALGPDGKARLKPGVDSQFSAEELEGAVTQARRAQEERRSLYAPYSPSVDVRGRVAVLVDDGLASGQTSRAALRWIRKLRPAKLLLAVPCASIPGLSEVRSSCDGIVTLVPPDPYFTSVAAYYENFAEVSPEASMRILREVNRRFLPPKTA
jgi:putative phosphoribosyl transferase